MSIGRVTILLGIILLGLSGFWACNYTHSGGSSQKDVLYTINGLQISHNADDERDYTIVGVGTDFKALTWYCGNYNGFIKRYVQLTFKKQNSWILDSQEIRSGNCS